MTGFLVKKVAVQCMLGMMVVVVYEGRCPGHPYAGAPPLSRINWLFLWNENHLSDCIHGQEPRHSMESQSPVSISLLYYTKPIWPWQRPLLGLLWKQTQEVASCYTVVWWWGWDVVQYNTAHRVTDKHPSALAPQLCETTPANSNSTWRQCFKSDETILC